MVTLAEENYLKAILKLSKNDNEAVSTNIIAKELNTKPSSVTDMIKKLTEKELVIYQPYFGVKLNKDGYSTAIEVVRKHRLWEVFLVNKLKFQWDEVHDVAEQLEHVKSKKLTNLLDAFLGYPQHDPHGEPIPDQEGVFPKSFSTPLSELNEQSRGNVVGVSQDNPEFLKYLDSLGINIGTKIKIIKKIDFDLSLEIEINGSKNHVSSEVAKNLLIKQKK
jgi:DtxR family transcriptional regulator, Mn-dependent transcriptional regulator